MERKYTFTDEQLRSTLSLAAAYGITDIPDLSDAQKHHIDLYWQGYKGGRLTDEKFGKVLAGEYPYYDTWGYEIPTKTEYIKQSKLGSFAWFLVGAVCGSMTIMFLWIT